MTCINVDLWSDRNVSLVIPDYIVDWMTWGLCKNSVVWMPASLTWKSLASLFMLLSYPKLNYSYQTHGLWYWFWSSFIFCSIDFPFSFSYMCPLVEIILWPLVVVTDHPGLRRWVLLRSNFVLSLTSVDRRRSVLLHWFLAVTSDKVFFGFDQAYRIPCICLNHRTRTFHSFFLISCSIRTDFCSICWLHFGWALQPISRAK